MTLSEIHAEERLKEAESRKVRAIRDMLERPKREAVDRMVDELREAGYR